MGDQIICCGNQGDCEDERDIIYMDASPAGRNCDGIRQGEI